MLRSSTSNLQTSEQVDLSNSKPSGNWGRIEQRFDSPITKGVTDAGKDYLKQLNAQKEPLNLKTLISRADRKENREHKNLKQTFTFEEAKFVWWRIVKAKLKTQNREFEADGNDLAIYMDLIKYFINDESSNFKLDKGLLFMGNVGPGKTFCMEVFKSFCDVLQLNDKRFKFCSCCDVYDDIGKAKNKIASMSEYYKSNYAFDDLGDEPLYFKDYGNDIQYMLRILTKRYEAFSRGKLFTFMTTNLTVKDVENRYGERIYDRFKQMFNVVGFTAQSKRK